MSLEPRRMALGRHHANSLLPSLNFKHIVSSLALLLLVTTSSSTQQQPPAPYDCPSGCECNQLELSARCESVDALVKSFSAKHNNLMPIRSLDLSNNRLTKISNQLELLVNLTALDLSHNQLTQVHKLHFAHLEHLDLSHNRITSAKLSKLPRTVVHLNLTHNEITYLPVHFMKLKKLRTLELNENPLNCTCDTLMVRNWIGLQSVWSSHAIICHAPQSVKGQPWLQARQNDICIEQLSTTTTASVDKWENFDADNDVMMGDQPIEDEYEMEEDVDGKQDDIEYEEEMDKDVFDEPEPKPLTTAVDEGEVDGTPDDDELKQEFMPVHEGSTPEPETSAERTSVNEKQQEGEEEDGSGDHSEAPVVVHEEEDDDGSGSGFGAIIPVVVPEEPSSSPSSVEETPDLSNHEKPDLGVGIFEDAEESTEAPAVQRGAVVNGDPSKDTESVPNVETQQAQGETGQVKTATTEDNTGTYILLAIIGILLVSLIIFVAMKNRQEKRQARNRYDVEKNNATELQDMDKRLLGKPIEKNGNGKAAEHSPLINEYSEPKEYKPYNAPAITVDEPVQELPRKSQQSLYDNTLPNGNGSAAVEPVHGNGSVLKSPDSEEEVFHPAVEEHNNEPLPTETLNVEPEATPKRYSPIYNPTSPRSARYSPVYDEQGRVKIKLTETPKPKTPVIVNRTRSRAGEYVNTPN